MFIQKRFCVKPNVGYITAPGGIRGRVNRESGEVGGAETGAFGQDVLYERVINENLKNQTNRQNDQLGIFFDSLIYTYWYVLSCITTLLGVVIFLW